MPNTCIVTATRFASIWRDTAWSVRVQYRGEVGRDHCRLMPPVRRYSFYNEQNRRTPSVSGFYLGAANVADSGYVRCGNVEPTDLAMPRSGLDEGVHVRMEDVAPLDAAGLDAYAAAAVRIPIGSHNGSANALIEVLLPPGGVVAEHRLEKCEQLYFVVRGRGVARSGERRASVRSGNHLSFRRGCRSAWRMPIPALRWCGSAC